jgi:drug/metabolite transporter (DMT)-like permease
MTAVRWSMALMALFTALWAAVELLGSELSRAYSPFQVVFSRYVVHLAFMFAIWGWRDPASLWRTSRPGYQLARSALMLCMPAAFVASLRFAVPVSTVFAVAAASPILILALAWLFLGEQARWPTWAASVAAAAGGAVALEPGRPSSPWLLLLPLGMAGSFSLYVVMTRSLRTESTRANLFFTAAGVAAVLAFDMPRVWIGPTPADAAVLVAIGLLGWVALWALDRMAALSPVSAAAPFAALYAVFAVAGHALLDNKAPGRLGTAALALVLVSGGCVWAHAPGSLIERTQ